MDRAPIFSAQARREAIGTMVLWLATGIYVCGFAYFFAYTGSATPILFYGVPVWVIAGVFLPWAVCLVITIWAAFRGIRDEELGDDPTGDHVLGDAGLEDGVIAAESHGSGA